MLDELLKELRENSLRFPHRDGYETDIITTSFVEKLIKKYITPENCELWLKSLKDDKIQQE